MRFSQIFPLIKLNLPFPVFSYILCIQIYTYLDRKKTHIHIYMSYISTDVHTLTCI